MELTFVIAVDVTRTPVRTVEEFFDEVVMGDMADLASVAAKGRLTTSTIIAVGLL